MSAVTVRFFHYTCLTFLSAMAAFTLLPSVNAQTPAPTPPGNSAPAQPTPPENSPPAQPAPPENSNKPQPLEPKSPNVLPPQSQNNSLLSVPGGQRLMAEASSAVSSQNYQLASKKLQEARQVFNQISNFYQELATSFSGIDNRIADSQRQKALETAQMRDEATYQLALVHRAQNQPELAVPLLVQIIRSQNPTRDLGKKAYQQLFELGFVDSPFPKAGGNNPPTSSTK